MKKIYKGIIIATCCALLLGTIIFVVLPLFNADFYMFSEIDECERLLTYQDSNARITQYSDTLEDPYVQDLKYNRFWGVKYQSSSLEYEIFAYEFETSDAALTYYANVTDQTEYLEKIPLAENDENKHWVASQGIAEYEMIVILGNKAYRLTAPSKDTEEILDILSDTFSIPIP